MLALLEGHSFLLKVLEGKLKIYFDRGLSCVFNLSFEMICFCYTFNLAKRPLLANQDKP